MRGVGGSGSAAPNSQRNALRRALVCRVRAQLRFWARILTASTSGLSPARARWLCRSAGTGFGRVQVFAVNPLSVARYRERHQVSGAKSDGGDAKVLADLVRTEGPKSSCHGIDMRCPVT
jgi:hypothetical protein